MNSVVKELSLMLISPSCHMLQPIQLISSNIEVAKAGKIPGGKTEIPFEFPLHTKGNKVLYETYHGVFVNIQVSEKNLIRINIHDYLDLV